MEQQWLVSILVGAIGGFFDGLYSQGDVTGITRRQDKTGRTIHDLGTIGHVLTGAVAGFISYALNFGGAGFNAPVQLGPTAASLLAGIGGSEFLRRYREGQDAQAATKAMGRGVEYLSETIEKLAEPQSTEEGES